MITTEPNIDLLYSYQKYRYFVHSNDSIYKKTYNKLADNNIPVEIGLIS